MLSGCVSRLSFACALIGSLAVGQEPQRSSQPPALTEDHHARDRQFQEMLTGVELVGSYTIAGQENEKPPQPEKYTILRVSKLQGDVWLFTARIRFGEQDVTVPLPLEVKWAGDTPVIQVTDLAIPLLGRYTARVVVYGDEYAGLWSGSKHGGHMFGRIERAEPKPESRPAGDPVREMPPEDDKKEPPIP